MDDYELIDAGDGRRLERFGPHVVDRPQPSAIEPPRRPAAWTEADLRFDRYAGWSGSGLDMARADWAVMLAGIRMGLHPTDSGQVGVFPEHAVPVEWLRHRLGAASSRGSTASPEVLNLFGYTGLLTLALARIGAAVTHVDASRPSVTWARENAVANDLEGRPIRWIVDDAARYAARELRRERRYDAIVLDPPTYGHADGGVSWRLERDLPPLLSTCAGLLRAPGALLLTAHREGLDGRSLQTTLAAVVAGRPGRFGNGDLALAAASGARLWLGAYATWEPAA